MLSLKKQIYRGDTMKKAITILAVCSLLLTACGQIDDTESKVGTTTAIASESTAGEDTAETSSAKRRKEYKRSHDYYEKEFANGILFLKADGYHSNYDPKIQFIKCERQFESETKQCCSE